VLAVDAVKVVDENVGQDEAVLLLGHALKIKAERNKYKSVPSEIIKDHFSIP
jgi:uncharacterized protein (DUF1697 family)